jgi:hypothetical protein
MGRSVGRLGVGVVIATSSLLLAPLGCFSKDSGGSDAGANFGGADAGALFGDAGNATIESLAVVVYSLANDVESLAVAGAVCIDLSYAMTGCADEVDGVTTVA